MNISKEVEVVEVIHSSNSRRRWVLWEATDSTKDLSIWDDSLVVAIKHGIPPSKLFYLRKQMENGTLKDLWLKKSFLPQSEVNELKRQIKQLESILGKKTVEKEIGQLHCNIPHKIGPSNL